MSKHREFGSYILNSLCPPLLPLECSFPEATQKRLINFARQKKEIKQRNFDKGCPFHHVLAFRPIEAQSIIQLVLNTVLKSPLCGDLDIRIDVSVYQTAID